MNKLNAKDSLVHEQALNESQLLRTSMKNLVETLIAVEESKIHRKLEKSSLFIYATELLKIDEAVAYALIAVARKSKGIPALRKAIALEKLSPSKASRIVSTINPENADELIQFASGHTSNEIDYEMAKRNPKAAARDRVKALSEELFQVTVNFSKQTLEFYQRIRSLLAQKGKPCSLSDAIAAAPEYYLDVEDPVRKAERSSKRKERKSG